MYYFDDNANINQAHPLSKYMNEAYKVFMCLNNNPFIQSTQNTNSWRRNNNVQSNPNSSWQQHQQRPRRNSNSPEDISYRCDSKSPSSSSSFVEKRICFICEERGHIAVNCSKRDDFKVEETPRKSPDSLESIKEDENSSNSSRKTSCESSSNEIEELERFVLRKSEAELKSLESDLRKYKQRLKIAVDNARSQEDLVVKTLTNRVKDIEGQIEKLKVKCEQYRQTIRMFKQMR